MSTPSNIDLFNEYAGKTFALLYENFPIEKSVTIKSVVGRDEIFRQLENGVEVPTRECEIAFFTIKWLVESGYITAEPKPWEYFRGAVLTAKGLELLKLAPDSLKESFGDRLVDACKQGALNSITSLAATALTSGLGIALHSALSVIGS